MYLSKSILQEIKLFYFGELMNSFDPKSHNFLKLYYKKYISEVNLIAKTINENKILDPKILDVGGGLGIPSIILSKIFNFKNYVLDRYDEFSDEHDREVGTEKIVVKRLQSFGVIVYKENFLNNKNNKINSSFDVVTNFSVIEHIATSPFYIINALSSFLKKNGFLILSTPNQAHIFNRFKLMLGKNVWEDLSTFSETGVFFGHVREYLLEELCMLIKKNKNLVLLNKGGLNYSIYVFFMKKFGNKLIPTTLSTLLDYVISIFPKFCLQLYIVAKIVK